MESTSSNGVDHAALRSLWVALVATVGAAIAVGGAVEHVATVVTVVNAQPRLSSVGAIAAAWATAGLLLVMAHARGTDDRDSAVHFSLLSFAGVLHLFTPFVLLPPLIRIRVYRAGKWSAAAHRTVAAAQSEEVRVVATVTFTIVTLLQAVAAYSVYDTLVTVVEEEESLAVLAAVAYGVESLVLLVAFGQVLFGWRISATLENDGGEKQAVDLVHVLSARGLFTEPNTQADGADADADADADAANTTTTTTTTTTSTPPGRCGRLRAWCRRQFCCCLPHGCARCGTRPHQVHTSSATPPAASQPCTQTAPLWASSGGGAAEAKADAAPDAVVDAEAAAMAREMASLRNDVRVRLVCGGAVGIPTRTSHVAVRVLGEEQRRVVMWYPVVYVVAFVAVLALAVAVIANTAAEAMPTVGDYNDLADAALIGCLVASVAGVVTFGAFLLNAGFEARDDVDKAWESRRSNGDVKPELWRAVRDRLGVVAAHAPTAPATEAASDGKQPPSAPPAPTEAAPSDSAVEVAALKSELDRVRRHLEQSQLVAAHMNAQLQDRAHQPRAAHPRAAEARVEAMSKELAEAVAARRDAERATERATADNRAVQQKLAEAVVARRDAEQATERLTAHNRGLTDQAAHLADELRAQEARAQEATDRAAKALARAQDLEARLADADQKQQHMARAMDELVRVRDDESRWAAAQLDRMCHELQADGGGRDSVLSTLATVLATLEAVRRCVPVVGSVAREALDAVEARFPGDAAVADLVARLRRVVAAA